MCTTHNQVRRLPAHLWSLKGNHLRNILDQGRHSLTHYTIDRLAMDDIVCASLPLTCNDDDGTKSAKEHEKLTNCGTKAADVPGKCLAGILQCEYTEYSGPFANTVTSQRLSIQSIALAATVWPKFKGEILRSKILGVTGVLAGWDLHQSKNYPRLPNTCQLNFCAMCRRLAAIPMSCHDPQFDRPNWGGGRVGRV